MSWVLVIDVSPEAYEGDCDDLETFGGHDIELMNDITPTPPRQAGRVTLYARFDDRESAEEAAAYFAERVEGSNPTIESGGG